jgi:hypothetical protein
MRTPCRTVRGILSAVSVVAVSACGNDSPSSPYPPLVSPVPSPGPVPQPQGSYTVSGFVSEVVGGATVALHDVHVEDSTRHVFVKTAADGSYTIRDVPTYSGSIYLYFAKTGYQSVTRTLPPTETETRVDVQLLRQ